MNAPAAMPLPPSPELPSQLPSEPAAQPIAHAMLAEIRELVIAGTGDLWEVLERRLGLTPAQALARLGATLRLPTLRLQALHRLVPDFSSLSLHEAIRSRCLIVRSGKGLLGVVTDPFDFELQRSIAATLGRPILWHLSLPGDLLALLSRYQARGRNVPGVAAGAAAPERGDPLAALLQEAFEARASDIHFETVAGALRVRYRVDGVLRPRGTPLAPAEATLAFDRLKAAAGLRGAPGSGAFRYCINGEERACRVSLLPGVEGEDAAVRLEPSDLPPDRLSALRLDALGFDADLVGRIRHCVRAPHGLFLVVGPAAAGKTATLYAALNEVSGGGRKVVTLEDPVEGRLPEVLQVSVDAQRGLSYAQGLRELLAHDPDRIALGEISDAETLQLAVESALAGHMVLSSLRAASAADAFSRCRRLGVEPAGFAAALNGILVQRLVRVVCPHCAGAHAPTRSQLAAAGVALETGETAQFRAGRGCERCQGSGYYGRRPVGELLRMTDALREAILARAPLRSIKEVARAQGTRFLRESALDLVRVGTTTFEEIDRVLISD